MSIEMKLARGLAMISSALLLNAALPHEAAAQKIVTIVLSEEPDTLDACNANRSAVGRVVKQNVNETLTEIDTRDGSIQPRLATSWQKIDDTTWRFNLREGVSYTDGAPLDAETVAKSISRTMDTELACLVRTSAFGDIKLVSKPVSKYVLDIVTSKPDPILPTRMGVLSLASPNTRLDKLVIDPVGTGPYMLERYAPGTEVVLKRNPNYWGKKPEADGARYIWRGEPAVRAAMVKLGEADIAPDIAKQDATDPKTDTSYPNSETNYLRIDAQLPPLNDRRVRLALNYAVDRDGLRGTVVPKEVLHATQMVAPSIIGHNHDLDKQVRAYDPNKARQLLAEAKADGVPVDRKIQMIGRTGFYPNSTELIEAVHSMYKAVGLNVELRVVEVGEWVQFNAKPFKEGRDPIIFQHMHDNNKGDPVFSVFNKYACGGTGSTQCNPELDKLIAKASVSTGQERTDSWKEIFRIVYEDMAADVWLYHMVGYARVNPRIDFKPTMATNSEIHIEDIAFK